MSIGPIDASSVYRAFAVIDGRTATTFNERERPESWVLTSLPNILNPQNLDCSFEGTTPQQKAILVYTVASLLVSFCNQKGLLKGKSMEQVRNELIDLFKRASRGEKLSRNDVAFFLGYEKHFQGGFIRPWRDCLPFLKIVRTLLNVDEKEIPLPPLLRRRRSEEWALLAKNNSADSLREFCHETLDWYGRTAEIAALACIQFEKCEKYQDLSKYPPQSLLSQLVGRIQSHESLSQEENALILCVVASVVATWKQDLQLRHRQVKLMLAQKFLQGDAGEFDAFYEAIDMSDRKRKYQRELPWLFPLVQYVLSSSVLGKRQQRPEAFPSPRGNRESARLFASSPRDVPHMLEFSGVESSASEDSSEESSESSCKRERLDLHGPESEPEDAGKRELLYRRQGWTLKDPSPPHAPQLFVEVSPINASLATPPEESFPFIARGSVLDSPDYERLRAARDSL